MWKSNGSRPAVRRAALAWSRFPMNAAKFEASADCSPPIEPESSTTNSTSALERFESWTRSVPGWMRQWPTGLKL